jgi:uncharacterized protein YkwD
MKTYEQLASNIDAIEKMGNWIVKSQMFGCGSPEQGCVIAMDCFITGIPIMEYQKRNMLVSGNPSIPYDAMIAAFQEAGGKIKVIEKSPEAARIELTYDGSTTPFEMTWEQASKEPLPYNGKEKDIVAMLQAGKKPPLKSKYATPRSRAVMMYARVVSDGIRTVAASVNFGRYTPEEISDFDELQPEASQSMTGGVGTAAVQPGKSVPSSSTSPSVTSSATATEATPATATETTATQAETVSMHVTDPATEDQKKRVIGLMGELVQMGVRDIGDRVKNKLTESGIQGGVLGLTYAEADALINALAAKNLDVWCELALQGHAAATAGNG